MIFFEIEKIMHEELVGRSPTMGEPTPLRSRSPQRGRGERGKTWPGQGREGGRRGVESGGQGWRRSAMAAQQGDGGRKTLRRAPHHI